MNIYLPRSKLFNMLYPISNNVVSLIICMAKCFSSAAPTLAVNKKRTCGADSVCQIRGCGKALRKTNGSNTPHPDRYVEPGDAVSPLPHSLKGMKECCPSVLSS